MKWNHVFWWSVIFAAASQNQFNLIGRCTTGGEKSVRFVIACASCHSRRLRDRLIAASAGSGPALVFAVLHKHWLWGFLHVSAQHDVPRFYCMLRRQTVMAQLVKTTPFLSVVLICVAPVKNRCASAPQPAAHPVTNFWTTSGKDHFEMNTSIYWRRGFLYKQTAFRGQKPKWVSMLPSCLQAATDVGNKLTSKW